MVVSSEADALYVDMQGENEIDLDDLEGIGKI